MDPLSFTASLMTVSGVTIMTSKLVYRLREKVKNAPKDVGDLLEQLQTFQELLEELQTQLQDFQDNAAEQSKLLQLWGQSVAHMQRDVESLHTKLFKFEQLLKKKSMASRVLLSARQILSEKKVAEYQRKIDTHCGLLTCIKTEVCDQKLSKLTQNTIQLGSDNRAGFQTISAQVSQATGQLGVEANAGFSNVSSDLKSSKLASDEMHRALQSHMDDHAQRDDAVRQNVDEIQGTQTRAIEITESGFQAVQSGLATVASFNREGHESTHAMLRQQETLMQQLGKHIAFGGSKNCVRAPRTRWLSNTPMTTFYWKTLYHSLPLGNLRISLYHSRDSKGSEDSTTPERTNSNIEVTFVPPKWLTCLAVDYRMKLVYNSIEDQWHWGVHLKPLTVNQNPFVLDALKTVDLGAIQKSFREGLLHPTDYVSCGTNVWPWYTLLGQKGLTRDHPGFQSLFVYMAENGLPGQEFLLFTISLYLRVERPPTLAEDILQNYVPIYVQHGGNLFTGRFPQDPIQDITLPDLLLRCRPGTVDLVCESLFHSSGFLTVDEFSSSGICLLGTVAHVNQGFRTRLKAYLASYRSPLLAAGSIYADSLLESTFSIASVLSHYHKLDERGSKDFLVGLCRTGTPSMLRPFIDAGIDLNDDQGWANMLGNAAAAGNLDIVCMLIESSANSAPALYPFLRDITKLSDGLFKALLELLVENARPTSFRNVYYDALSAVIRSSRALLTHPEAPEILIRRKVFSDELINCSCGQDCRCNYMCIAIGKGLGSVVEALLQHAAYANTMSTWLMFSIECGAASCTEALIQYGADVNFLDGAGGSALQLARLNVTAPHPRKGAYCKGFGRRYVTAEEDAKTLAVVERAFHLKAQGTTILEEYEPKRGFEVELHDHGDKTMPVPQKIFEKARGFFSPSYISLLRGRRVRHYYHGIGDLWSLSFYEALLMRFFYLLSYVLLLALGILAFIRGDKRVRMPSRSILSAVALLLLAFIWGTSLQTGLPSKPDTGRSVTKQDS